MIAKIVRPSELHKGINYEWNALIDSLCPMGGQPTVRGIFPSETPSIKKESTENGVYTAKIEAPGINKENFKIEYDEDIRKFSVRIDYDDSHSSYTKWKVEQPLSPKSLKASLDLGVLTITAKVKDTVTKVEIQ